MRQRALINMRSTKTQETGCSRYNKNINLPEEDRKTIDLIGEKAYRDMNRRIDEIMQRHAAQRSLTLSLTCGPDNAYCARELHHLLPGEELNLLLCSEGGVEWVDAYHNGARIGRLTLIDSQEIRNRMNSHHVTGVYVAEQNCYEIEESYDLRLIMFYEPARKGQLKRNVPRLNPGKIHAEICQN